MNRPLFVILLAVSLDAVGIGLIFPILPRLLEQLGGGTDVAVLYGGILALYAAMQFVFSPILGVLSDRFGRRPVLLLSLAGAAVDYLLMAFAPELWMLVVGRAIAGITSANMAVATAYITDITPEDQRARRFGLFHAMFGIGFIVGPVLGGLLGDWWIRAPFIAAAAMNGANLLLALFVLPESRPRGMRGRTRFEWRLLNPLGPFRWVAGLPTVLPLIAVLFLLAFGGQMYGTVWALFGGDAFGWNGFTIGLSLGGYGLFHAVVQAVLPGPMTARFGERNATLIGLAAESAALIATAAATSGLVVFAVLPLFALGGVGVPALQSLATRRVDADRQGQFQGLVASIVSLASIFGPLVFGVAYFLVLPIWPGLIWLLGVGIYLLAVPVILSVPPTEAVSPPGAGSSGATS
jgi:DHA1 family tetracycline resistance protein-like MFS transporter